MNNTFEFLSNHPLFKEENKKKLQLLSQQCHLKTIKRGQSLNYQGKEEEFCYIITNGKLIAYREKKNKEKKFLGELKTNDIIGETPLFAKMPWHINLFAPRETDVITISKNDLITFLQACPNAMINFINSMSDKFYRFTKNILHKPQIKTIAITSMKNNSQYEEFIRNFVLAIKKEKKTLFLSSHTQIRKIQNAIKEKR